MRTSRNSIIPCFLSSETQEAVEQYALALKDIAPTLARSNMSAEEFWRTGVFRSAIERIRGQQSAAMTEKRNFMTLILNYMKNNGSILEWQFKGSGERFDYEIKDRASKTIVVETKGCLDGNNTNIFSRPPNADEFYIWSLCQNPGSDPRHNAWSGIHTRLSAEVVHRSQQVDGVIIWDMLCGTIGRPCPKLQVKRTRTTHVEGMSVPPPCLYIFPRSIPEPRNNPHPNPWSIDQLSFLSALYREFKCDSADMVSVNIKVRMEGPNIQRRTSYFRDDVLIAESKWTTIRRSR